MPILFASRLPSMLSARGPVCLALQNFSRSSIREPAPCSIRSTNASKRRSFSPRCRLCSPRMPVAINDDLHLCVFLFSFFVSFFCNHNRSIFKSLNLEQKQTKKRRKKREKTMSYAVVFRTKGSVTPVLRERIARWKSTFLERDKRLMLKKNSTDFWVSIDTTRMPGIAANAVDVSNNKHDDDGLYLTHHYDMRRMLRLYPVVMKLETLCISAAGLPRENWCSNWPRVFSE